MSRSAHSVSVPSATRWGDGFGSASASSIGPDEIKGTAQPGTHCGPRSTWCRGWDPKLGSRIKGLPGGLWGWYCDENQAPGQRGSRAERQARSHPLFCSTYFRYLLSPYVMLNIKKHVAEIPPERADISQYSSDAGDYSLR